MGNLFAESEPLLPSHNEKDLSSLDELFRRSKELRTSQKFVELLNFVRKFRHYALYNNFLVYLQNPNVTYYATATHWWRKFGRRVKEDARPMIILAPMTPVLLVYDLDYTEGPPLPDLIYKPFETKGILPNQHLGNTLENCKRDSIDVQMVPLSSLNAGKAISKRNVGGGPVKMFVRIHDKLDRKFPLQDRLRGVDNLLNIKYYYDLIATSF